MTESAWRKAQKSGMQRTRWLRGDGDGPKHASGQSEVKPTAFHCLDDTEEGSESQGNADELSLDDDPRVNTGLNRLIDIIVNTANSKPRVGGDDG